MMVWLCDGVVVRSCDGVVVRWCCSMVWCGVRWCCSMVWCGVEGVRRGGGLRVCGVVSWGVQRGELGGVQRGGRVGVQQGGVVGGKVWCGRCGVVGGGELTPRAITRQRPKQFSQGK